MEFTTTNGDRAHGELSFGYRYLDFNSACSFWRKFWPSRITTVQWLKCLMTTNMWTVVLLLPFTLSVLVAFGYKYGLRSNLRAPDLFLGEHVPRHPSVRTHHQRCPTLRISLPPPLDLQTVTGQSNKQTNSITVHIIPLLNGYSQTESLPFLNYSDSCSIQHT